MPLLGVFPQSFQNSSYTTETGDHRLGTDYAKDGREIADGADVAALVAGVLLHGRPIPGFFFREHGQESGEDSKLMQASSELMCERAHSGFGDIGKPHQRRIHLSASPH